MTSVNILRCEVCGGTALVVHMERPLCVECLMTQVAQSREQLKMMREVRPLSFDQLQGNSEVKASPFYR